MNKVLACIQDAINSALGKQITTLAETAGESKLSDLLQQLHDEDPTAYTATLEGFNTGIIHLKPLAAKTESTIDDAVLQDLETVITASAAKNNFTL